MVDKVLFSSEKSDWETPDDLFDALHREFNFTIDLAANVHNSKLVRFYSEEDDALSKDWIGERAWVNPPYIKGQLTHWVYKCWQTILDSPRDRDPIYGVDNSKSTRIVALLPARTDTAYWQDFVMKASEIRFIRGRLKFKDAPSSAPFPSAIVIWDDRCISNQIPLLVQTMKRNGLVDI